MELSWKMVLCQECNEPNHHVDGNIMNVLCYVLHRAYNYSVKKLTAFLFYLSCNLMPRPSTGPKTFWAGTNVFSHTKKWFTYFCLVLLQVPKCFVLVQIFWASPKNLFTYCASVTNILCQTKRWFAFSKIGFCGGTKGFE